MSTQDAGRVQPSLRVQILAAEHWSLLATRSQTWSEVTGRVTAHFTFASSSLLALALVVQVVGLGWGFRVLALWLGLWVVVTGTLTALRTVDASAEDLRLVEGMTRLRSGYVAVDPSVASLLVTGSTADAAGLDRSYDLGLRRSWSRRLLASVFMFIATVNTVAATGVGAVVGVIVGIPGPWWALVGVVAGTAYAV